MDRPFPQQEVEVANEDQPYDHTKGGDDHIGPADLGPTQYDFGQDIQRDKE